MKYIVILGDGMSDLPLAEYGQKTPLELANKPNIDALAKKGIVGLCKTVPDGFKPGSDVANLSVMGYDPALYYTGRSPIEAVSMGISLNADDVAVRCNLVTLSDAPIYGEKTMLDYSAGEISTEEAAALIDAVGAALGDASTEFYPGVSYRHCMVLRSDKTGTELTPPHDISDRVIGEWLPRGLNGARMLSLMQRSYDILSSHPINIERVKNGKNPANSIWLWGEGTKLSLKPFDTLYGKRGAVISAVDLVKGIGISAGMDIIEVEGATGNIDTNYLGKAEACVEALLTRDYVYLHIEAADECGHQGDAAHKIKAIEYIDSIVVKYIQEELERKGVEYRMLITPDHPTPLATKTHSKDPVPFIIYDSRKAVSGPAEYSEAEAKNTGCFVESGPALQKLFLEM